MNENKLLEDMAKLGVPMMLPEKEIDAGKTLAEVVKSRNARLWENFPALLAESFDSYGIDLESINEKLDQDVDSTAFYDLCALSNTLYKKYHLQIRALNKELDNYRRFSNSYAKALLLFRNSLAHDENLFVGNLELSTERVKNAFESYLGMRSVNLQRESAKYKELSLEYSLAQLFSPKQKELFFKRLNREKMTKTEREYYYRVVKKKVQALANSELHSLAQKLMEV